MSGIVTEFLDATPDSLGKLGKFYRGVYTSEFPDENERELLENMENYLRLKTDGWYGLNNYHVLILLDSASGRIAGGCIADYLERSNVGVIEFMVVDPEWRGGGLGRKLLAQITKSFQQDALRAGHLGLNGICGEVNDPYRACEVTEHLDGFERLNMWHRFGFRLLDFPYVQPALSDGQDAVAGLGLMFQPYAAELKDSVPAALVRTIVADFQIWAMRIPNPDDCSEFQLMSGWLEQSPRVNLLNLQSYACAEPSPPFHAEDIGDANHSLMPAFRSLYTREFHSDQTAEDVDGFGGSRTVCDGPFPYHYFMWGLVARGESGLAGLASFFGFSRCGFGGYLALGTALRGKGHFRQFIRLIEKQLVRSNPGISGWYVECDPGSVSATVFSRCGFSEVPMGYFQPKLVSDTDGSSDGYRLTLLYKPLGRVYRPPVLTVGELKKDLAEIIRVVYRLDDTTAAYCLQRNRYPGTDHDPAFQCAAESGNE